MIYARSEKRVCVRLCVLDVFDKTVLSVDTVARIYTGLFIVVHQFWPYAYKQVSCIWPDIVKCWKSPTAYCSYATKGSWKGGEATYFAAEKHASEYGYV